MRFASFVFLAAFCSGCVSETTEGPGRAATSSTSSAGSGASNTAAGTGGSGNTSSAGTSGAAGAMGTSGTSAATGSSGATGAGGNAATGSNVTSATGAAGGGASGAAGGGGSAGGSGGSSGGAPVDASVETGPPPDPGPLSGGGAGCNDVDPIHQGSATFYNVTSTSLGHCSFDLGAQPQPPYWVAMNFQRFSNSSDCGACVQATGPSGSRIFQVIDECPNNPSTDPLCQSKEHLDLSQVGLTAIGGNGRIDSMTWKYVPCDVQMSNVEVFTQANSNMFFATIGLRKHRYRVAKVELVANGMRAPLVRRNDNFFIIDSTTPAGATGMALGPLRIRVTDIYGHWIENKITLVKGQNVTMALQFPACPGGGDAG